MTGNGVSASLLGRPDVGLIDLTLLSQHAHRAAACVDIPLICDADTGYGNAVNVRRTVRGIRSRRRRGDPYRRPGLAQALRAPAGRRGRSIELDERSARSKRRSPRAAIPTSSSSRAPTAASGARARRGDPPRQGVPQGRRGRGVRRAEEQPDDRGRAEARDRRDRRAVPRQRGRDRRARRARPRRSSSALGLRIAIYPGLARYAAGYGIREALGALKRDGTTKQARDRMLDVQGIQRGARSSPKSRSGRSAILQ